jgi:DNA-binding transcriptional ArsR family regulator
MVVYSALDDAHLDRIFHALSQQTRRDILRRTLAEEQSVSQLAGEYSMSFAAVQKHVAVLESAELIIKRAEGRPRRIRANPDLIANTRALLAEYERMWRDRFDRLDALLAEAPDSTAS